jgi:hypothetical protein
MSTVSNYLKGVILDKVFINPSVLDIENIYIGLWHTTVLDELGDIQYSNEVSSPSYSRAVVPFSVGTFSEVFDNQIKNSIEITFPEAGESWGLITHVAFFDVISDEYEEGHLLFYSALSTSRQVDAGDTVRFPSSSIRIVLE